MSIKRFGRRILFVFLALVSFASKALPDQGTIADAIKNKRISVLTAALSDRGKSIVAAGALCELAAKGDYDLLHPVLESDSLWTAHPRDSERRAALAVLAQKAKAAIAGVDANLAQRVTGAKTELKGLGYDSQKGHTKQDATVLSLMSHQDRREILRHLSKKRPTHAGSP